MKREAETRAVRIAGEENGSKFVDKQNYSSFSGRNNFLGIYPGDTRRSYSVQNSYDASARARPRIKGSIPVSCYADDEHNTDL